MTNKIKQQLVILLVLYVGLVFCYVSYILQPLDRKYKTSVDNLNRLELKLTELKARAQQLPRLRAEMDALRVEVAELERLLPQDKEIPSLLRIVTKRALRYNLKFGNFTPGKIEPKDHYNELPFDIALRGRYHMFAHFLADIGQDTRLMSSKNIKIAYQAPEDKTDPSNVSINFTLIAYSYKQ